MSNTYKITFGGNFLLTETGRIILRGVAENLESLHTVEKFNSTLDKDEMILDITFNSQSPVKTSNVILDLIFVAITGLIPENHYVMTRENGIWMKTFPANIYNFKSRELLIEDFSSFRDIQMVVFVKEMNTQTEMNVD